MTLEIAPTQDIAICRALRRIVFIDEQGVSEADEVDDKDGAAIHLLAQLGGVPIGSARLLCDGATGKIGRVCVLAEHRGSGAGAALIRASVAHLRTLHWIEKVKLGAQVHALGFYEKLGFAAIGEVYQDAGIAHRHMILML